LERLQQFSTKSRHHPPRAVEIGYIVDEKFLHYVSCHSWETYRSSIFKCGYGGRAIYFYCDLFSSFLYLILILKS
jgi:hypothetical protein